MINVINKNNTEQFFWMFVILSVNTLLSATFNLCASPWLPVRGEEDGLVLADDLSDVVPHQAARLRVHTARRLVLRTQALWSSTRFLRLGVTKIGFTLLGSRT